MKFRFPEEPEPVSKPSYRHLAPVGFPASSYTPYTPVDTPAAPIGFPASSYTPYTPVDTPAAPIGFPASSYTPYTPATATPAASAAVAAAAKADDVPPVHSYKICLYISAHGFDDDKSIRTSLASHQNIDYRIFYEAPSHGCPNFSTKLASINVRDMNIIGKMYEESKGYFVPDIVNKKIVQNESEMMIDLFSPKDKDAFTDMIRRRRQKYIMDNYFKPGLDRYYEFYSFDSDYQDYHTQEKIHRRTRGVFIVYSSFFKIIAPFTEENLDQANLILSDNYYQQQYGLRINCEQVIGGDYYTISLISILQQLSTWFTFTHNGHTLLIEIYDTSCRNVGPGFEIHSLPRTRSIEDSLKGKKRYKKTMKRKTKTMKRKTKTMKRYIKLNKKT